MTTVTETTGGDLAEGGSKKPWLLIGGGVAAAALIGGGAFAATQFLGGTGDRPDSVLPGGAAFYAQVDLDPSVGEKVSAVRFFRGLDPELRARFDEGSWREWAWDKIQEDVGASERIDFETEIEPWLGDRAGVAVLPAGEDEDPVVAVALQVKDGDAALAFFDEHAETDEEFGYYLESDYLVFSEQETLETVRSAAAAGNLADNETFSSDMGDLGDQGIMAFWADAAELDGLAATANPALPMAAMGLAQEAPEVTGRTAGALRLTPDAIELHGVTRGVEGIALPGDSSADALLPELPADTAVAFSLENGAAMVQAAWDHYSSTNPDEVQQVADDAAANGFTLPDDLKAVLGDSMTLSVGPGIVDAVNNISPTDSSVPAVPVGYRVTTDTSRLQTLLNENGVGAGVLLVRDDNGTLTLGSDQTYVDALADGSGETLGSDALFTSAMPDVDDAQAMLYVNVNPFEQYYLPLVEDADARTALETLGAVGLSGTNESDSDGHFTLRFVADPE